MLNSPKSQILGSEPVFLARGVKQAQRLGDLLLQKGLITPKQLTHALARQRSEEAHLGEILVAQGIIAKSTLLDVLAQQINVPRAPLLFGNPTTDIKALCDPSQMVKLSFVPFSYANNSVAIAFSDPSMREEIERYFWKRNLIPNLYLADRDHVQSFIMRISDDTLCKAAETACPIEQSCRNLKMRVSTLVTLMAACAAIIAASVYGMLVQTIVLFGLVIFLALASLKFAALIASAAIQQDHQRPNRSVRRKEKVTLLVPLFKESEICERLIPRLQKIEYPAELLEIILICEANDSATQSALSKHPLPIGFRKIIVPRSTFNTKPRAMNYALSFASGSIIGVYDAEDAPEADQVAKAVSHLQTADLRVACVQARLDFYNHTKNWIARCFALEYNILFRIFLPGLMRMDLPIPLGGTSIFIRRDVLEEVGQWDAHNVTEDADLGMRLYRHSYRVECLDSTTYEEANYRLFPWIKQRSRWLKGFFLTWATHMQNPRLLYRDAGFRGFLAINLLFFATVINYMILPVFLPLWLISFAVITPDFLGIPISLAVLLVALLIFAEP